MYHTTQEHTLPPSLMASSVVQSWVLEIYSRRLLLHRSSPTPWITAPPGAAQDRNFDPNVVMIIAVLLCALVCALGLNSVVRCALRWSTRAARPAEIGLRKKALRRLPSLVYSVGLRVTGSVPECAICLSEFVPGEQIRVLPKCHHGFHLECIDRWLAARSSCPTCRRSMFAACEKTSTSSCAGVIRPIQQPVLVPLQPEGLISTYPI